MPKPWFLMTAGEGDKPPVIDILGEIGDDFWDDSSVSAKEFNDGLKAFGDVSKVKVRINSPGGSYFQGVAIANIMKTHPAEFTTCNIGEASSAASVIFAAGDVRIAMKGTLSLIHDPAYFLCGGYTSDEMVLMAEQLEKTKLAAIDIYVSVFKLSRDEIAELMKNQTLVTADEAVEYGYATESEDGPEVIASASSVKGSMEMMVMSATVSANKKELAAMKAKLATTTTELSDLKKKHSPIAADADAVMAACEEAKMISFMPAMLKAKLPLEQVTAKITEMKQVADVCMASKIPVDAVLSHHASPSSMVRVAIAEIMAAHDLDISSHHRGEEDDKSTMSRQPNRKTIFQKRNSGA